MRTNRALTIIGSFVGILITIIAIRAPRAAYADSGTLLSKKVTAALRADRRLNGANCYTEAPGVIILTGKVFDENARKMAETTAYRVRGVKQVVNTLRTETGQWLEEESKINDTLALNGLQSLSVRVIGSQAYLSGQVTSQADQQRALRVIGTISNLQVVNFSRIVPGSVF
ncbi:MAG: BON domain-containing protein [Candidatus Binataceae bacterium]